MSALRTRPTRGEVAATTSTACLTTAITSSHSPSMLVNIALVSQGRPEARTTRTASATASLTPPVSSPPDGLMLKATIMRAMLSRLPRPIEGGRFQSGPGGPLSLRVRTTDPAPAITPSPARDAVPSPAFTGQERETHRVAALQHTRERLGVKPARPAGRDLPPEPDS